MTKLLEKKDLTRWNRAGLSRFRYIDGNAMMYLETLRQAMLEQFTFAGNNQWSDLETLVPVPDAESEAGKQARWKSQYQSERRDHAWEILRAYARASHVLMEHVDVYANEKYLRTATQWQNVRSLVALLDYYPAPPASAEVPMAFFAKADKEGQLPAGFAFKNKPVDKTKPVVFETLEDLDVHPDLNELKARDWNKSRVEFDYDTSSLTATFPLQQATDEVSIGTKGILLIERENSDAIGIAIVVAAVSTGELSLAGEMPAFIPTTVYRHQVRLLLKPRLKKVPKLTGSNIATLTPGHGLAVNSVVAWQNTYGAWQAARVEQVTYDRIHFSSTAPEQGDALYLCAYSEPQEYDYDGGKSTRVILPSHSNGEREYNAEWDEDINRIYGHQHEPSTGTPILYDYFSGNSYSRIYYVPVADEIATVLSSNPQGIEFEGTEEELVTGDWLIAEQENNQDILHAVQLTSLVAQEDSVLVEVDRTLPQTGVFYGGFKVDLRPADYDVNQQPVYLLDPFLRSDHHSVIELDAQAFNSLLDVDRKLIVAGSGQAMEVKVKALDITNRCITVAPAIPGSEPAASGSTEIYTRFNTTIYGNVAKSGHGETQKQKVLGSGDATRSRQSFLFDMAEVSFVNDGNFPPGVRADLDIEVEGRTWQQVASLNDSVPEDPHYIVRMMEDGKLTIIFGDGRLGRRLPSGNNNVRICARKGTGLAGNLKPLQLNKEVKPHYLIDKIIQPMSSSGGNDMEEPESMRENAPQTVLTLERAVSLSDFVHLARTNSSVWDAAAKAVQPGLARSDKIKVAIVPAGGGEPGSLQDSIALYLKTHALPGVAIEVQPHRSIILSLEIVISVKPQEYDPDVIAEHVRSQLLIDFSLKNSRLGAVLYRSQIFAAVESVAGVENCRCTLAPDGFVDETGAATQALSTAAGPSGALKRISPDWDQIIYLDDEFSLISISTEDFGLQER